MAETPAKLPDIQATPDERGIAIDQVGISDLRHHPDLQQSGRFVDPAGDPLIGTGGRRITR
jgi:GTP cyclohydrolase FolE2